MNLLAYSLILLICLTRLKAEVNYQVIVKDFECKTLQPLIVERWECWRTEYNKKNYANGLLRLQTNVKHFELDIRLDTFPNGNRRNIANFKVDGCRILEQSQKLKVIEFIMRNFRKSTNIDKPMCPFKSNFTYTMTNYSVENDPLPIPLPAGDFSYTAMFIVKKKPTARVTIDVELKHIKTKKG